MTVSHPQHPSARNPLRNTDVGPFLLWIADAEGNELSRPTPWMADALACGEPKEKRPPQDPSMREARRIVFGRNPNEKARQISPADIEVADGCDRIVDALNHLYPAGDAAAESRFRLFYRSVYGIARVALQRATLDADIAKRELDVVERDVIHDVGPAVKAKHIRELGRWALTFSLPLVVCYVVLSTLTDGGDIALWLQKLGVNRAVLANFLLVWIGCFIGVCLSYALRKPDFTKVEELIVPEADLLMPVWRLLFTGALAMLLVMLAALGLGEVKFADASLADAAKPGHQMLAFAIGALCGMGEKLLSPALAARTTALMGTAGK